MGEILRFIGAFLVYVLGFTICDGTWWKEMVLVICIIIGGHIQND